MFTQVYYPHRPYRARATTVDPGAKASYGDQLQATAGAAGITVLRDDVEATVLRLEFDKGRVEHVVFNPGGQAIDVEAVKTDRVYAYCNAASK